MRRIAFISLQNKGNILNYQESTSSCYQLTEALTQTFNASNTFGS